MKSPYLLPNYFKKTGWFLLIPGILFGIISLVYISEPEFLKINVFSIVYQPILGDTEFFSFTKNNIFDEIIGLLLIIGSIFIALSKEKSEDEFISKIRLESLVWATYLNYFILVLSILFIYEMTFFLVLVFNMFTILLFFIIRFNWVLYKSKKQIKDEE